MVDAWASRLQEIYSSTGQLKIDSALVPSASTVAFSTTPTFDATKGNAFQITLTADVTASTLSGATAGQFIFLTITQDATGGWTFVWPTNFQNAPTIVTDATKSTNVVGYFDGTNFNIAGQWNTVTGPPPGTGTVTSVGMTGDGVVYKATVPGSPVTTSGTLVPDLASANSGFFLAGPQGSLGSNVGIRQWAHATFHVASNSAANQAFAAPAFSNPVIAGNMLLVIAPGSNNDSTAGFTDTLGNTFSLKTPGGSDSHQAAIAYTTIAASGTDTVSGAGIHYWTNGGSWSQYDFWVLELTGANAINLAYNNEAATDHPTDYTLAQAITPGAATDTLIRLALTGCNNVGSPNTGSLTFAPVGSTISTFTAADVAMGFGKLDYLAPGSTASVTNNADFHFTASTAGTVFFETIVDVTQSASAGSAPWVGRRITEGDLPASSISALQSVNKYNIGSIVALPSNTNTTVLSETITMPSDGGPFRVLASYSAVEAVGGSGTVTSWISDGTNDGATMQADTTDATAMPINCEGWFGPYSNNQSVTFTWKVNPGTYATGTYEMETGWASSTSSESGHMTLTVMQSRN